MRNIRKVGNISIQKGALLQPHELDTAKVLAATGENITFLRVNDNYHTADIDYLGNIWEIKSPKGKSKHTIENNLRLAIKQSPNVIIDLKRINRNEDSCIAEIRKRAKKLGKRYKIIIITKNRKIIKLF